MSQETRFASLKRVFHQGPGTRLRHLRHAAFCRNLPGRPYPLHLGTRPREPCFIVDLPRRTEGVPLNRSRKGPASGPPNLVLWDGVSTFMSETELLRLNKALAAAGYCSRRQADTLIACRSGERHGRSVTELGIKVDPWPRHPGRGWPARDPGAGSSRSPSPSCCTKSRDGGPRPAIPKGRPHGLRRPACPRTGRSGRFPVGRLDYFFGRSAAFDQRTVNWPSGWAHPRWHVAKRYRVTVRGRGDAGAYSPHGRGMCWPRANVWLRCGRGSTARARAGSVRGWKWNSARGITARYGACAGICISTRASSSCASPKGRSRWAACRQGACRPLTPTETGRSCAGPWVWTPTATPRLKE